MAKTIQGKRVKNIFNPKAAEPFALSRSKLDDFFRCERCFYMDRRLGVEKPSMPGFTLNIAVDALLKKEFDIHRAQGEPHPLMKTYGVDAVPYRDERLDEWRNNFKGIRYLHEPTNLLIYGAIDDVWVDRGGKLAIVDYKATSTSAEVTLEGEYKEGYKRQMEIYQWLFRRNGFNVADVGYFVYANGQKDRAAFDGRLEFEVQIIPYKGNDGWVEDAIMRAKKVLMKDALPDMSPTCEHCAYRAVARSVEETRTRI
ncbi:MAG: PD-(D/E)XK nuclease family protein [bacterium]|nr:PD-(D/E)XK nuclease family protein [bacterium]